MCQLRLRLTSRMLEGAIAVADSGIVGCSDADLTFRTEGAFNPLNCRTRYLVSLGQFTERHALPACLCHFIPRDIVECGRASKAPSLVDSAFQPCLRSLNE